MSTERNTPEYQVLVQNLKTLELEAEIPWTSINITEAQDGLQSASFQLPLSDTPPVFGAGRSAFIVFRGGIPLGKFIVTEVNPTYPKTLAVKAMGTLGYLARRRNRTELNFDDVDQFEIVRQLVSAMQSSSNGDLDIRVTQGDSGVKRTRFYPAEEQLKYLTMITEMADATDGFNWRETINSDLEVTLELSPIGFAETDVVFDLRKNLRSLSAPESADILVNQFTSFSKDAEGARPLSASRANANSLAIYPQYDGHETTDLPADSTSMGLLGARAQQAVDTYSQPTKSFSFEVEPDIDSEISRYGIGSLVRLTASYGYIQEENTPLLVVGRTFALNGGKETISVSAVGA